MQLSSRPLFGTTSDNAYYVERGVENRLRHSVAAGLNVLILGSRRSGKTSLAYRLADDVERAGSPVLMLDGSVYSDERSLLDALCEKLPSRGMTMTERVATALSVYSQPSSVRVHDQTSPDELALIGMIERRVKRLQSEEEGWRDAPTPVFIIDGMPSPGDAHRLFGRHRDLVWRIPAKWVVTGSDDQRASYLRPPADSFFETVIEIGGLDTGTQQEILARRIEKNVKVDPAVYLPNTTPGDLIARARAVLLEGKPLIELVPGAHLAAIEAAAGRPGVMLAAEMASLGAVSASDERLQRRLGWTRSRLNQVLRALDEAGLVRASYAEATGPGRPQKLYELVDPADWDTREEALQ